MSFLLSKRSSLGSFFVLLALVSLTSCFENSTSEEAQLHSRLKRWINFPINGGVAKIVIGGVFPVRFAHKLARSLNCAHNLQANYAIPERIIWPVPEHVFKQRLNDEFVDRSRPQLYRVLERMVDNWGGHGRSCLLRTICQVAETPLGHNGMLGEILDVIFTPYEHELIDEEYKLARKYGLHGVNCNRAFHECSYGHEMFIRFAWFLVIILSVQVQSFSAFEQNQTCLHDIEHDVEEAFHHRHKRWLTMIPNGGVCKIVLSSATPVRWAHKVVRSVALAVNLQANYAIPARIIWPHAENFFKERVLSADYVDNSRKDLYRLLERIFQSWGGDGRECLLKTICQVAETPLQHNGLIGEILDVVFT
ncbi:hypothetical protein quinque_001225 [Culex quinquefasciatus]